MKLLKAIQKTVSKIFKIDLTPLQAQLFEYIRNMKYRRVEIRTTTQWGKSLVVALAVLWVAKKHKLRVLILAPTEEQSKIIMRYLLQFIYASSFFTRGLTDVKNVERMKTERKKGALVWADGTSIRVFTVSASNTSGVEGKNIMGQGADLIVVDEAGLIPNNHFAKILRMLGGNAQNSRLIKIGNPFIKWDGDKPHHFYKSSVSDRYIHFHVDYKDAIREGRLTDDFVEEAKNDMSPLDFKVLYEVEFPDREDELAVFSHTDIAWELKKRGSSRMAGLDVSGAGSDDTVLTIASVEHDRIYVEQQIKLHGNLQEKADEAHKYCIQNGVSAIGIDVVGIGKGVADIMSSKTARSYEVLEYIAGASPNDKLYSNLKSELIFKLWKMFKDGMVGKVDSLDVGRLTKEMLGLRQRVLADKKKKTEDPADSPDYLDSLLATLYAAQNVGYVNIDIL